ncbi:MAG: peptidoglycan DD-metalloendopeptidase family protein [Oceanococcus sp.]
MKFDAIVTERPTRSAIKVWPTLLAGLPVFALAFYLAGDGAAGESALRNAGKPAEVSLINRPETTTKTHRSLLTDIAPISSAQAAVTPNTISQPISIDPADISDAVTELTLAPGEQATASSEATLTRLDDKVISVREGDSLSILFDRNALKPIDWMRLAKLKGDAKRLLKLRPGDRLMLGLDEAGHVAALDMRIDTLRTLKIRRNDEGRYEQSVAEDAIERVQKTARGSIESSLFLSAKAAGLSDNVTMEFTDIYAWDVDFALDIRSGDSFELVYEEIHRDGKRIKDGDILAARFTNRGKALQAVRYVNETGQAAYYSAEGKPMKKAFLRSPVDFTRISSRFSLGRKHPILNKIRAHKGVDYAAPRGTPVKSAGAGKVIFAGNKGGYGRVLIVQHAGKYKTLYAHLNSFRRGVRRGSNVSQGETIGFVGSSGLATGPHLHYEFQVGGRHVDPLRVKLPTAPTLHSNELARFKAQTAPLLALLKEAAPAEQLTASN